MNPTPFPQPFAQTCPNCGSAVEGNARICPRCGAVLKATTSNTGCLTILAQIFLACVALVLGLMGACFVLLGVGSRGSSSVGIDPFVLWGVGGVVMAGLCVWGIIKLAKR
jgi:predicted nucleic acid-binding Zn ribbon protein